MVYYMGDIHGNPLPAVFACRQMNMTPERLSAEAKEALRRFDELTGNTLHQNDDADDKPEKGDKKKKKGFMDKMKEVFED